jgi:hypothetical protein
MRSFVVLAFDDFIDSSTTAYSSAAHNELLASADQLALFAVADAASAGGIRLSVQLEQSADQRNWENKSGSAEISLLSLAATATTVKTGYDDGANPSDACVRAKLSLDSGSAHVKLWITGRSKSKNGAQQTATESAAVQSAAGVQPPAVAPVPRPIMNVSPNGMVPTRRPR